MSWRKWERSSFGNALLVCLVLWLSLSQIVKAENSQVVSLVIKDSVDAVVERNDVPVASKTQWKVAKVLQQAQDREKLAVEEVLKEEHYGKQTTEEEIIGVGNVEKEQDDSKEEEENLVQGNQHHIDTVAKLFQWSIVASTNRNTESVVKKPVKDDEKEEKKREESVSFIQHVTQFFRKARNYGAKESRKTRSWNRNEAATFEQDLLYAVLDELFASRSEEEKTEALEILADLSHKMDNARDVLALGGIERMLEMLGASSARLRSLSLYTLAVCAQNNQVVQTYLMQPKRLERLVYIAERDEESDVRTTALLALSSVVDNENGMDMLRFIDGVESVLLDAVQNEKDARAVRRALNLASDLVVLDPSQWLEKLKRARIFEFAEYYLEHHEDRDIRESAAQLLSWLTK